MPMIDGHNSDGHELAKTVDRDRPVHRPSSGFKNPERYGNRQKILRLLSIAYLMTDEFLLM